MYLIYPMFAMVVLTFLVAQTMLRARIKAVRTKTVHIDYFKTFTGAELPDFAVKPARHYVNLFEAPTLFYVACLAAMIVQKDGILILSLAWTFVILRYIHAFIHIGSNDVLMRMRIFMLSMISLLVLWLAIVI